jgi:hypothetical protein
LGLIAWLLRVNFFHPLLQPLHQGKGSAARLCGNAQILTSFGDHVTHLAAEKRNLTGVVPASAIASDKAVRNQTEFTCVLEQYWA